MHISAFMSLLLHQPIYISLSFLSGALFTLIYCPFFLVLSPHLRNFMISSTPVISPFHSPGYHFPAVLRVSKGKSHPPDSCHSPYAPATSPPHLSPHLILLTGHPLPEVRWVSEGEEVIHPRLLPLSDGTTQLGSIRPVPVRSAVLVLPSLTRRDDGRRLRCEARSTNLTLGLHKEVTLTMHCECCSWWCLVRLFCLGCC